ncbi:MAG: DUF1106 domain-containing protein [Clostridiales bacterium]|nr:DUF1106 domain-containing protein [Clostridiales bacterium]
MQLSRSSVRLNKASLYFPGTRRVFFEKTSHSSFHTLCFSRSMGSIVTIHKRLHIFLCGS